MHGSLRGPSTLVPDVADDPQVASGVHLVRVPSVVAVVTSRLARAPPSGEPFEGHARESSLVHG